MALIFTTVLIILCTLNRSHAFFRNVQEALCMYYDCGKAGELDEAVYNFPCMTIEHEQAEDTVQRHPCGSTFTKAWVLRNPGEFDFDGICLCLGLRGFVLLSQSIENGLWGHDSCPMRLVLRDVVTCF